MTTVRAAPFQQSNIFGLPLVDEIAHDGTGVIHAVRIATAAQLSPGCEFIDYAIVPPGTSIGDHRHAPHEEEFYLVLSGTGTMRLEDETFPVSAGDLIRNLPGGLHGLANDGIEDLRLFIFAFTQTLE
jgi:oxalate decarboxylase/phosphoglucose isomerase-like protein (cupin superfamily)